MKCNHCGEEVKSDCNWRQGRCPHLPPMIDNYHARFYNLLKVIKQFFTKGDCDCGHKH